MKYTLALTLLLASAPLGAQAPDSTLTTLGTLSALNTISPYASTNSLLSKAYAKHLPARAKSAMGTPTKAIPTGASQASQASNDSLPLAVGAPIMSPPASSASKLSLHPAAPDSAAAPPHRPARHAHHLTPYEYYMQELSEHKALDQANANLTAATQALTPDSTSAAPTKKP